METATEPIVTEHDYYFIRMYPVPRPKPKLRNAICSIWGLCIVVLAISVVQDYHVLDTEWLPNYETSIYQLFPYLITLSEHS